MDPSSRLLYPSTRAIPGLNSKFPSPNKYYPLDASILNYNLNEYLPVNSINPGGGIRETFIEFSVPGTNQLLDLSQMFLYLTVNVGKGAQNEACVDADHYLIANHSLHSMFSSIEVYLNNTLVSERSDMYSLVSYLQTCLGMPSNVKETLGYAMGYREQGSLTDAEIAALATEVPDSSKDWKKKTEKSKSLELIGNLLLDISTMDSFLLSGVDLTLRLHRQPDAYVILSPEGATKNFRLNIQQCRLFVKRLSPAVSASLALEQSIQNKALEFMFKKTTVKSFNIQTGELSHIIENPFHNHVPKMLILCIVKQSAMYGDYNSDPTYLQHMNLNRILITLDGTTVSDMKMDFASNSYVLPYFKNFLEHGFEHAVNGLTFSDFKHHKNAYIFDLSTDDSSTNEGQTLTLNREGLLRISLQFAQGVTENATIVLLGISQGSIFITKERRVVTNYIM